MVSLGGPAASLNVLTCAFRVTEVEGSSCTEAGDVCGLQDGTWGQPRLRPAQGQEVFDR